MKLGKSDIAREPAKALHHAERQGFAPEILFKAQRGRCWICNGRMKKKQAISRDHIYPKSKGGRLPKNTLLAHEHCNWKRQDTMPTLEQRLKLRYTHIAAIALILGVHE